MKTSQETVVFTARATFARWDARQPRVSPPRSGASSFSFGSLFTIGIQDITNFVRLGNERCNDAPSINDALTNLTRHTFNLRPGKITFPEGSEPPL